MSRLIRERLTHAFYSSIDITIYFEGEMIISEDAVEFTEKSPYDVISDVAKWASRQSGFSEYDVEYGYSSASDDPKEMAMSLNDRTVCRVSVVYDRHQSRKRVEFLWALLNTVLKNHPGIDFSIETGKGIFERNEIERDLYNLR